METGRCWATGSWNAPLSFWVTQLVADSINHNTLVMVTSPSLQSMMISPCHRTLGQTEICRKSVRTGGGGLPKYVKSTL